MINSKQIILKITSIILSLIVGVSIIIIFTKNNISQKSNSIIILNNSKYNYSQNIYLNNNNFFNNITTLPNSDIGDPFLFFDNDKYYLFGTLFGDAIWMYVSNDLQNWSEKIKVFDNPDSNIFNEFYAPEVYKIKNEYYIIFSGVMWNFSTNKEERANIYVAKTNSLEFKNENLINKFGNYKKIDTSLNNARTIDGNLLFDDDGKIYMYFKSEIDKKIYVEEVDNEFNRISEPNAVLEKEDNTWEINGTEGPFCIKKDNKYYLMYSSGAYSNNTYMVGYATSNSPTKNFTKQTIVEPLIRGDNVENNSYDTIKGIYGTGHNMIFKTCLNEYYCVYHRAVLNGYGGFLYRRATIDRLNFINGKVVLEGPTKENQPLPSGTFKQSERLFQLNDNYYSIINNNDKINNLFDGITYYSKQENQSVKIKNAEIKIKNRMNVSDVWIYSNGSDKIGKKNITITINDEYNFEKK